MSMLTIIQQCCKRYNVPVPSTVYGTTDPQVGQMLGILEEEGNDLAVRASWQRLTFEASHTTLNQEDQGAITTIASNGFRYIKNNTIWDRTEKLPVIGPMSDIEWQALKGFVSTGPRYQFRIRGNKLLVNPSPTAGNSWYFEYVSYNWITDSTGATYRNYFAADDDLVLFDETLLLMGLRWRWAKEKGLEYAELFRTYEMQIKDAIGRDGGKQRLQMDAVMNRGPQPGIFVPQGSWDVS